MARETYKRKNRRMGEEPSMGIEEILAHIMEARSCNRRQARRELFEAIRDGKLTIYAVDPETGASAPISAAQFKEGAYFEEVTTGERIGAEQ